MSYELPDLPFAYDTLEPYMDAETMKIHHGKHHAAYVAKLNSILEKYPKLQDKKIENLLDNLNLIPKEIRQAVINFGGGHYNHAFFWKTLTPKKTKPSQKFAKALEAKWGSLEKFKEDFSAQSASFFGSGWTWLVLKNKELKIITTSNQDSPISNGYIPIITLDLWEHSYYLKYQNRRQEYIEAFWNIINRDEASRRYEEAIS